MLREKNRGDWSYVPAVLRVIFGYIDSDRRFLYIG
jgi:hypothetical protein